jgi:hypothetical protein
MLRQILTACLLTTSFLWILGCETNNDVEPDTEPPAIPRGVKSITRDGEVIIEWYPNGERDLAGYKIWRSSDDDEFELLTQVSDRTDQYIDRDVQNGVTYFYAVSALDFDGNESDLSPELVTDTPRPSGNNVTLNDFTIFPERSGFDLSQPEKGAIPWNLSTTDVYVGFDTEVNVLYLYSDNQTEMQDMGYHESSDEIDMSPPAGFTIEFVELIEGHVYVLYTPDGNFAKIHVVSLAENAVTIDWAYQIDPENPQLAPPLRN